MGTDLDPIANHNLTFGNKSFSEIAKEIVVKLNDLQLHNDPFLIHNTRWTAHSFDWEKSVEKERLGIKGWTYHENKYTLLDFEEDAKISFNGPFDLEIEFDQHKIIFHNPVVRYSLWFDSKYEMVRNEWRKYLSSVVKAFGGNRVVYLADNSHPLEDYFFFKGNFIEMEQAMRKKLGKPKKNFSDVLKKYKKAYFIDHFTNLDLNEEVDYNEIMPLDRPKPKKRISFFGHTN